MCRSVFVAAAGSAFTPRRHGGSFALKALPRNGTMRRRVRYLVVAAIIGLLLIGGVLLRRVFLMQQRADPAQLALDLLPHVAQRIRDFHRVKIDNGRKVWELSASEAQYHDDTHVVVVTQPLVSFFMEDGRELALQGAEGRVFLGGRDLQRVELSGGIRVQFGDYALRTPEAYYDRSDDRIIASGPVQISGRELDLEGEGLEIQVAKQRLLLRERVEMVLRPEKKTGGGGQRNVADS